MVFRLSLFASLLAGLLLLAGCDSNDSDDDDAPLRQISYNLAAQSNSGAIPSGVNGTVTFWEVNDTQTLITLELDGGATGAAVSHPAHIHENDAATGGPIAIYLSPIDGTDGSGGTSARLVNRSFDEMAEFDGYVNIHESVANLSTVVSQGNVGANASGTTGDGLDLNDPLRQQSYALDAQTNNGSAAPNGIDGGVVFTELTDDLTLVSLQLDITGATGADVSHVAHIHDNDAATGGPIAFFLSPIDGTDEAARSDKLVGASFDTLIEYNGYVNIHESAANLGAIVSQGNIGANASSSSASDDGTSGGGY